MLRAAHWLFVLASVVAVSSAGFQSTVVSSFAWKYHGALNQHEWWPVGYAQCDAVTFPLQSPIFVDGATMNSTVAEEFVISTVGEPVSQLRVIFDPENLNLLRADVWPSDVVVDILRNGESPSSTTKFIFHHIVARIPAEHQVNGTSASGELDFVFFPYTNHESRGLYRSGGVTLVRLFNKVSGVTPLRGVLDEMLSAFSASKTFGLNRMPFTMPAMGHSAVYTGSLTFPPCSTGMTTIVSLNTLQIRADTFDALVGLVPQEADSRPLLPRHGRDVRPATVTYQNFFRSPISLASLRARPAYFTIRPSPLDVTTLAYGYGALCLGLLCALLLCAVGVSYWERITFVSASRDVWRNCVTQQAEFGAAHKQEVDQCEVEEEEGEEDEEVSDGNDDDS